MHSEVIRLSHHKLWYMGECHLDAGFERRKAFARVTVKGNVRRACQMTRAKKFRVGLLQDRRRS